MRHSSHGPFGSRLGRAESFKCADELSAAVIPLCLKCPKSCGSTEMAAVGRGAGLRGAGQAACAHDRGRARARARARAIACASAAPARSFSGDAASRRC